ncbi:MAG: hypothetical protein IJV27_12385 [Prevotella sp.]|nr:hypothetical protein [Prevotella sp.]
MKKIYKESPQTKFMAMDTEVMMVASALDSNKDNQDVGLTNEEYDEEFGSKLHYSLWED